RAAEVPRRGHVPGACAGAVTWRQLSARSPARAPASGWYGGSNRRRTRMACFVCVTCGTQFADAAREPDRCPVCEDERQYVGHDGQQWTTLETLRATHRNRVEPEAEGLLGIGTEPGFAIGQRALLVHSPGGNLLWDCITLVDDEAVARVREAGGIRAIAISHPHYYSGMVEWSRVFGDVPILLHAADRQWVMRDSPAIDYWEGD